MLTDIPLQLPATPPGAVLIAYSGGMDSGVLLHALAALPAYRDRGLRALHVHHGLHADADAWAAHCQRTCAGLQVPLQIVRVQVARDRGLGLEAAARQARHTAFAEILAPAEWLALAHHRDDQAETFLLRALRASGPDGLAAMRIQRPFAQGILWRPLLAHARADLQAYARLHALHWIDDPSNTDARYDRNFLRTQVLPLLQQRWPQAAAALARSAQLSADASDLLQHDDLAVLPDLLTENGALDLHLLRAQPAARRPRLLRAWAAAAGAPPLPAQGVAALEREIATHAPDRQACFAWQQIQVRRWRHCLYLLGPTPPWPAQWSAHWDGAQPLSLPDGAQLHLHGPAGLRFAQPLLVRGRHGGERIVLPQRTHSHQLKHVLQTADLPPWQRERLPILWADDQVLAAGDRIVSAALTHWLQANGARLQWRVDAGAN
ncbi:tRNA lysidine(34) synthetase TilS [Xanthomonas vesicatoria]|uniref:tRNA lysidine(34) synthetase TilS n=1 Tax=Xanthomonas vesicatoria TaxID=56460 RepID=UPI0007322535|nr:tRNA lysidine(34) synthetase TilS [Xanthomonas vesicatoria]KTF33750.1 tRNA(Ile)-lysidine synthetase [Xanthomonas vesicatoria]MCC8556524.1 tRNA lysidine(34) synthetase TilS [Xanthomonas vesicatoria]MCC8601901.1 tRNA lysidine(34) synthetase TilS [Xanthomonas vesicatoria]MCC8609225.1 tRNA lysidine(34) synthetase TilS [Xanthomonas vesicatoria]MCC8672393.1 tRNA lysidine(34) synthetase TilS [Xanthomonas vesicatoria]